MARDGSSKSRETAEAAGPVTVADGEVRVEKQRGETDRGLPAVVYAVENGGETAVDFELADAVPDGATIDDVRFPDEYAGDAWTRVPPDELRFHRTLEAGETIRTVYLLPEAASAAGAITPPGLSVSDGDDVGTIDLEDPTDGPEPPSDDGASAETATGDDASGDAGPAEGAPGDGSVASALAADLRSGTIPEEDRETLQEEFDVRVSDSTATFVEHLQSRVESRYERIEEEVDAIEDSVTDLYGVKADRETIQTLRSGVHQLDELKADREDLEALGDRLERLEDRAAAAERVERLDEDLERLAERAADRTAVEDLEADLAAVEAAAAGERDLEALTETVEALEDAMARERDLESLADDVGTLEEETASVEAQAKLRRRVEALDDGKADGEAVEAIERDLREAYVTEADITDAIERRLRSSVLALGAATAGVGGIGASIGTAAAGAIELAGGWFVLGLALLGIAWIVRRGVALPDVATTSG